MTNGSVVREINEKYEDNCLEVQLGRDLFWFKEINDKGEVIENLLKQDVDGGMRGVDIFGDEHFVCCNFDAKNLTLLQEDGGVKRYARDERGMFYRADENFQIIRPQKVKKYRPVTLNLYDEKQKSAAINRVHNVNGGR